MKSNKGRKEPSSEIAKQGKLPLELVANTALHFLGDQPERRNRHPLLQQTAIVTAIDFLKLCAKRIEAEERIDAEHEEHRKEFQRLGWKEDDIIPYNEGIKYITGQKRADRAQVYYEAYRKNNWQLQKPLTASELTIALKEDEKKGFRARELPLQRFVFGGSRASGRLDLRRRNKKQKRT